MKTKLKECPNKDCKSKNISTGGEQGIGYHSTHCECDDCGLIVYLQDGDATELWNTGFIRESDNPWVTIGEGDLPDNMEDIFYVSNGDCMKDVAYRCGGDFRSLRTDQTITWATHYRLIPDPGTPPKNQGTSQGAIGKPLKDGRLEDDN